MRKILSFILILFATQLLLIAQCIQAPIFSLPDSLCLGEEVSATPLQGAFEHYEWDFYTGDITSGVLENSVNHEDINGQVNGLKGVSVVKSNNTYYAFIVMNDPIKILRVELGTSLENMSFLNFTDLGNPFNILNSASNPIRFYEEYGFISNQTSVVRLDFTDGFGSPPTNFEEISNSALEEFSTPSNLRIVNDRDSIFLLVCNQANPRHISVLSYGESINNTPILIRKITNLNTVNSSRFAVDLDLVKVCNKWQGYYFTNNGQFVILDFGNSLTNEPVKQLSSTLNVNGPRFLKVIEDEGAIHLALKRNNTFLYLYNLGFEGSNLDPLETVVAGATPSGNPQALDLIKENSAWVLFTGGGNDNLFTANFQNADYTLNSIENTESISQLPYTTSGTYFLGLRVRDSLGNIYSQIDTVEILNNLQSSYSFDGQCIDNPTIFNEAIIFNGLTIEDRLWSFGNGDTTSLENPTYQFPNIGTFEVQLNLTASNGCQSNFIDSIFITNLRPENPSFEYSPSIICENTLINFTNTTTTLLDSVVSLEWDFGDGNTSTDINPTHSYALADNYNVSLKVTGKFGCDTTISQIVTVRPGPSPAFQVENLCEGDTVFFTDNSTSIPPSQIISWEWDFGDASNPTSTQNPNHFYQTAGNYNVILTIETDSGCIASNTETITIEELPNSEFSSPIVCAMTSTNFESLSTNNIISWLWEVGEDTYSGNNAEIFLENEGLIDITLTTTSVNGCESSSTQTVEVFPALLPNFSAENLCFGDSVQFLDATPTFSNVEWLWNFGQPNAFSFEQNPKYAYNQPGVYNVTLNIQNAIGCESSTTQSIQIFEPPVANIANDSACQNQDFYIWNNTITDFGDSIISLSWLQSDSVLSNSDSILLNLNDENIALILQVETESGCKSEISKVININATPEVDFTFSPNYGTAPQTVAFENLSSGLVAYVWNFGDGSPEVFDENPTYTYQQNGEYLIQFTGFNELGCSNIAQKTIPIIPSDLDIELRNINLEMEDLNNGTFKITTSVLLFNNGTRLIENADLHIQLDDQSRIVETWTGNLNIGNATLFTFNAFYEISSFYDAQRICVEAKNVNDNTEIKLDNNRVCALVNGLFSISTPYPNPANNNIRLDMVAADPGEADIQVYNIEGKLILNLDGTNIVEGNNDLNLDVSSYASGKYFINIRYLNTTYTLPFVVVND